MRLLRIALAIASALMFAACGEVQIVEVEKVVTVEVPIEVEKIVIATPTPSSLEPSSASQLWFYESHTDPVSQRVRHLASIGSLDDSSGIIVRCDLNQDDSFDVYVAFPDEGIGGNDRNHVEVEYRFANSSPVAENWKSSVSSKAVFAPDDVEEAFARLLISASSLAFRAVDYRDGSRHLAEFTLDGQSDPDHPVRWVMFACGWDMDIGG
ncbi:MAG: hypothetical protein OXG46_07500 [Chloroflexi bacterium]|nr:hypothetical protein [Chloroflexota bacterium]MCY3938322.1 hypothetical protein [Chloroflexota bacterium]